MKVLSGEIRMLKWGVIPTQPSYQISVGQVVGGRENLEVTQIVKEDISANVSEWHIECAKKDDKGVLGRPFVWLTYYLKPDFVQYFVPDAKHDYVKV